jgi:hypothetical protein
MKRLLLGLVILAVVSTQSCAWAWAVGDALILRGDVVTMDAQLTVVSDGRVCIKDKKIVAVLNAGDPLPAGFSEASTLTIDTGGYIMPGLIDLHNHVEFNMLPMWKVPKLYTNRYQWTGHKTYRPDIMHPKNLLTEKQYLNWSVEVVKYAEVKTILGGTTAIQGSPNSSETRFLVRNVENQNFGMDRIYARALTIDEKRWQEELPSGLLRKISQDAVDAWLVHLAEGTDDKSKKEFATLKQLNLLRDVTVIIHGTALTATEFQEMAQIGAKLVWSPLSNVLLYGKTTDIPAALAAGVLVSLGADWSPSGSKNMLAEIKVAHEYDKAKWGHILSDSDLVKMVTINPAVALSWDDKVGRIKGGYYADIAVFKKNKPDAYRNLIEATERDVRLVIIDGVPYYGDLPFIQQLKGADHEVLMVQGVEKGLDVTLADESFEKGRQTYAEIETKLNRALLNDTAWLHQHFGDTMTETQFRTHLDVKFPGMHAIALDPLAPDLFFFDAIRQNVNAQLPFDIAQYWSQAGLPTAGSADAALLALLNKPQTTTQFLDIEVGINSQAANSIMKYRNGPDQSPNTPDDRNFNTVAEVDAQPYVGNATLNLIRTYITAHPN